MADTPATFEGPQARGPWQWRSEWAAARKRWSDQRRERYGRDNFRWRKPRLPLSAWRLLKRWEPWLPIFALAIFDKPDKHGRHGSFVWMHLADYLGILWHRLGCALGRVPAHGYPVRPAKRVLVVPIEGGPPPGASVDWRPGMMPQGRKQDG